MQIHWPLVISTACQRAGLGLIMCVFVANALMGAQIPLNIAAWVTLVLLVIGGCASIFHLQRPQRFFNAFTNLKSHLTQEGIITPFLGIALLLVALGVGGAVAEVICVFLALAFLVCTGLAYQMKSRPAWNTWYVLILFLLTALEAGFVGAIVVAGSAINALYYCAIAFICLTTLAQLGYIARMAKVGYGVAYRAFEPPYRNTALVWGLTAAVALVVAIAAALSGGGMMMVLAWACIVISIAAWTVLFFKGAHKVRMFPMYSEDLNLDM